MVHLNNSVKSNVFKTDFQSSFGYIKDILKDKKNKGSAEIRVIQWIPSCSIFTIENKNGINDQARIGINDPAIKSKNTEKFGLHLMKSIHKKEFNYFLDQFDLLWNDSENLDLHKIKENKLGS